MRWVLGVDGVVRRLPFLAVLGAGALRVSALLAAHPVITPDTFYYLRQSRLPLLSGAFWGSQHPPLLPLLWKIPGIGGLAPALLLNGLIAALAWGFLALTLAAAARTSAGGLVVATGVLALSLAPQVTGWESAALSESLSLSLVVLALALVVRYVRAPGRGTAIALGITVLAATLARDTNLPLLALAVLPPLVLTRRHVRVVVCFLAIAAALSIFGQQAGHRSDTPTRNAIGMALLHPENVAWFRSHGLPWSREDARVLLLRPVSEDALPPRAVALRSWVRVHGRSLWLRYLATHPRRSTELAGRLELVYDPPVTGLRSYWGGGARGLFPTGPWLPVTALLGLAGALLVRRRRETAALLSFVSATLPAALLVWVADAFEFERHAMALPVIARVVFVALAALGAEVAYERGRNAAVSIPKYVGAS